ncbi:transposase [Streptomyces rimosus]|uniref:transposase n=1 Tax=Streptomyces rimosus TaxID=1927 RepID=UPI0037CCECFE
MCSGYGPALQAGGAVIRTLPGSGSGACRGWGWPRSGAFRGGVDCAHDGDDRVVWRDRRTKGNRYPRGLMPDGSRDSAQAMASLPAHGNGHNLRQLVRRSVWDPAPVRRGIAERMARRMRRHGPRW